MKKEKDIDLQKCIESKQEQIIRVGKNYKDTHIKERKKETNKQIFFKVVPDSHSIFTKKRNIDSKIKKVQFIISKYKPKAHNMSYG